MFYICIIEMKIYLVMDKYYSYCSDKYQYTMGKSFLDCGKAEEIAVFNLFYLKHPRTTTGLW